MNVMENSLREDISRVNKNLNDLDDRVDDVGAMGAAFSALVPNSRSKGNTQLSVGVGVYSNSQAIAAGLFRYIDNDVLLNAGVSATSDEVAGRAGITFGW
jgi:autotransporter adhesin